jgi:hypothetical protein
LDGGQDGVENPYLPEDLDELSALLDSQLKSGLPGGLRISYPILEKVLTERGYVITAKRLGDHARRSCGCTGRDA